MVSLLPAWLLLLAPLIGRVAVGLGGGQARRGVPLAWLGATAYTGAGATHDWIPALVLLPIPSRVLPD